jgi:hypothetical protein
VPATHLEVTLLHSLSRPHWWMRSFARVRSSEHHEYEGDSMIRKTIRFLLGFAAIYALTVGSVMTASADNSSPSPFAITESGLVLGSTVSGVNEFLGILRKADSPF